MIAGSPVTTQEWIDQDGGEIRTEEIAYPLVDNYPQAHQLAAYHICNSREFLQTEVTVKPVGLNADVGDAITIDLPELNLPVGSYWTVLERKWDSNSKTATLSLKAETPTKHAFCLGQSPTPPTTLTLRNFDPTNPTGPAVSDWVISDNKVISVVDDLTRTVIPAVVVSGTVRDPNAQKIIVETRTPPSTQDVFPGGTGGLSSEDIQSAIDAYGWTIATDAPRTAEEIVVSPLRPNTVLDVAISYETRQGVFSQRRILGNVTTAQDLAGGVGAGGIDWSDNGNPNAPIVNVPPALGVDQNGQLQAGNVASGVPGFPSLAAFNAAQKIFNDKLAEDQADADQKITDGLAAEADARATLKTALELADQTITTNFNGLKNEVIGARGTSTTLAGRLTTLANAINGKVSATEIEALETEIADARGSFGSVASRLTKSETDISGKSDASRVTLLEARSKVAPNLIANGGFTMPLAGTWFLEGGAGPEIRYDGQVGSYLHSDGPYVVSEQYPFSPGYIASVSWSGLAANPDAHVYLQAIPSYQKLAHAAYKPGGWDQRHVSDGTSVAAPAGTTHLRAVIHTQNAALDVSRIKVNFGATATDWTDDQTDRLVVSKIATVETANANGASRITELEATSDDEYLTQNSGFTLYTNAAQTGFTTPEKWYPWGEKSNDSHRVPGHLGKYAWRSHNNLNTTGGIGSGDVGITQDFNNNPRLANLSPGYYVLEADIYLGAGEIGGAGVFWYFQNGDDHARINFATDKTVDGDVVGFQGASGRSYSWRKLVKINNVGSGNSVFHLMTEWDGFEGGARPKVIEWQRCGLRRATAQEVAAERADTNATSAQAKLVQVEQVQNEIVGRGGGGGNLVGNTSLESMTGWTPLNYFGDPSVLDTNFLGINYPRDDNWHPAQDNCLSMFVKAPTSTYADWYSDEFPLTPGKTYEFGMSAAVHRTYAECYLEVRLADGSQATYPWASCDGNRYMYENYSGGRDLRSYGQFWEKYTVPTNAAWTRGRLILRRGPTNSGQVDSWSWFTRPFVREIPAGQTKPSPWDYGAQRWLSRARWSVQPAVNGASSFITAEAVNSGGVATSNVSIGAQSIQMYNQNGQDWKLAMQVAGGNAVFTGNLQASRILLGNGTGWDIQKAQKVFSVTDGQVVNFGTDLGAIPSISFERDGLAPLNAGESYDVRALNISATGFQLYAKINIPAAQSSQQTAGPGYSEIVNSSGNSGRTLYLEGKPTAVDGAYRFSASGQQEHRVFGRGSNQPEISDQEGLDHVSIALGIWAYNGSWVKVATFYTETVVDPYNYPSGQMTTAHETWFMEEIFQLPANVTHVNITRESASNNRSGYVNSLGPVSWQAQGAGSGVRTATPNGAQTRVRIIPS
ncbi:hypothetical protein [uncultured Brevundimonas sp.]|uniref:hypothetical protein n=1 Tax=uncultured Brevundimonas sp. TaxID=213418 RepID=UPI0025CF67B4|nr:hypothetical protein [uncultured Brevundimonas sp.]